ncbi:MAG: hypothetical protein HOC70_17425 [Gammaproteobacteria bacterium]|nr:hypothetical protein [Gammaproteobacteria bacterium]MBT4495026.1 hypothetical protein [Gammaproteobacteria bacterium]MBT7369257.1 hypothetical protein [Gammaproteobacteria bacterium]
MLKPLHFVLLCLFIAPSLEAAPRVKASVEDLAWMSGSWVGPAFGQTLEENWIRHKSGTIACLVRLANDESISMVELILVEEEEQSLTLRVQQWGPGYKARMPEPLVMELVELDERRASFKAITEGALKQLTYSRPTPDSFNVDVVDGQGASFTINLKAQK